MSRLEADGHCCCTIGVLVRGGCGGVVTAQGEWEGGRIGVWEKSQ